MSPVDETTGARLTVRRRVAWAETDAAGHHHWSAAVRWFEEAEHELLGALGLTGTIPSMPRVHVEFDYHDRLWFDDELEITVGVISVGTSSVSFGFTVRTKRGVSVTGRNVCVHALDGQSGSSPWDDRVRALFASAAEPDADTAATTAPR